MHWGEIQSGRILNFAALSRISLLNDPLIVTVDMMLNTKSRPSIHSANSRPSIPRFILQYNRFILQYREHHDERSQWEMDQKRATVVDKYWETHDFDALTCSYYDSEKETFYQRRLKEMLLSQGTSAINKLPPTLAASESLMYDICTGIPHFSQTPSYTPNPT